MDKRNSLKQLFQKSKNNRIIYINQTVEDDLR